MRRLINVCGLPGSGKSTFAYWLAQETGGVAVAADDTFERFNTATGEWEYKFNPALLGAAHAQCQLRVKEALRGDDATVIVHNTGTAAWERQVYRDIAVNAGAQYTELFVMSGLSPAKLAARNAHGVPEEKIEQMRDRFVINF